VLPSVDGWAYSSHLNTHPEAGAPAAARPEDASAIRGGGIMHKSHAIVLTVAVLLASAGLTAPSSAQPSGAPERFHGNFLDVAENVDACGVNVDIVGEGVFTDLVFFDTDGNFVHFQSMASGTTTFTADNGKSVVVRFAGLLTETESIDEVAGTITFFSTNKGLPELIKTPRGAVLLRDAGVITFVNTFDLATGEFISGEITVNQGPHPEAESDFALFCEVISAALT